MASSGGWVKARISILLALVLLGSGCASLPFGGYFGGQGGTRASREIPLRIVRDEAPADYDVLVAERTQSDGDLVLARQAYERASKKDPKSAFIHERLARLAWQLDDMDGAVREAERAFELDPESVQIRLFLGRLYRLRRDFEGLDRVLRDEAGRPLDADSAYALYQVALEERHLDEAEDLARQLAAMETDQLRGTLALATVYEQRGDFESAETIVRQALDTFPDHFLLYMRLAQIERARGDRGGEIEVYREVLRGHPGHYGILQRLGQSQIDTNDLEAAIETFSTVVDLYPDDLNSLRRLASLEFAAGRYESAERRLEAVLDHDPDQPDLAFALGQIRKATGDADGAIEAFGRVAPGHPGYFDARVLIVSILESEGRLDEALVEIERLRSLRSDRQIDYHAAAIRAETGDVEGSITLLESLLDGSEGDAEVYYRLGVVHGSNGNPEQALRDMQRVLETDPNNPNALNYIGYSWADRGENLAEAEELIRRALELSPGDGYITDSLGWVYYKMAETLLAESRREEALRLLDRAHQQLIQAAELTGGDSVVSEHIGDVLLLRGDKQGALERYEEAVGLELREDEQPDLQEKLDRLRQDLGRTAPSSETP
jgi:tetratricopeptide (TPR) repeat protein